MAACSSRPRQRRHFHLKGTSDNPQRECYAIRDRDGFYQQHIAQYELHCWNVVVGKDDLDRIATPPAV